MLGATIAADLHRIHSAHRMVALTGMNGVRERKPAPTTPLSKRERQIITLLDEGLSNVQIGKRCCISEGTVKWYLHHLYEKLGVGNRTALLNAVRNAGLALA